MSTGILDEYELRRRVLSEARGFFESHADDRNLALTALLAAIENYRRLANKVKP